MSGGGFFYRGLCLDDTRKAIIKLIESGHRASQVITAYSPMLQEIIDLLIFKLCAT
jgi:hypothetical protein